MKYFKDLCFGLAIAFLIFIFSSFEAHAVDYPEQLSSFPIRYSFLSNDNNLTFYVGVEPISNTAPIYFVKNGNRIGLYSASNYTMHFSIWYLNKGVFSVYADQTTTFTNFVDPLWVANQVSISLLDFPYVLNESAIDNSSIPIIDANGNIITGNPFDPFSDEFLSDNIPAPSFYIDYKNGLIGFNNGSSDLNVIVYARYHSIDRILGRKKGISLVNPNFDFTYDSVISGSLSELVSLSDEFNSTNTIDILNGSYADKLEFIFQDFLVAHPINSRIFEVESGTFGTPSGWENAKGSVIQSLSFPNSGANSLELNVRYYAYDTNGNIHLSKWSTFVRPIRNDFSDVQSWISNDQYYTSNTPLSSDQVVNTNGYITEDMTEYTKDNSVYVESDLSNFISNVDFKDAVSNMKSLLSMFGEFPAFIRAVFSFLPAWMLTLIGFGITTLVVLGIYHGVRG